MGEPIVVFGSFVVDLTSRSNALPIPGQTILGSSFKMGPGGKGSNQAVAAHRAGANVTLVTKVGKDVFGKVAIDFYTAEGMTTDYILQDNNRETGVALICVDEKSAQNQIVVVPAACSNITLEDVENCRPLIEHAAYILLQHEINFDAQYKVIEIAHAAGSKIVLNPAPACDIPDSIMCQLDVVTPNETEAQLLTGVEVKTQSDAEHAAQVFFRKGVKNVVITMGALGAFASDGNRSELLPRIDVNAIDTTGAGDAFNGGFITALSEGMDLFTALRYGNATGALSVTKMGTAPAMPMRSEIDEIVNRLYLNS